MGEGYEISRDIGESCTSSGVTLDHNEKSSAPLDPGTLAINGAPVQSTQTQAEVGRKRSSLLGPPKAYLRAISCTSTTSTNAPQMKWGSLWIAAIVLFLVAVQFSIYFASLWPYMSQIDPSADQTFYGFTLAAYSLGQMLSSPLLGYLSNRLQAARPVIALGVCLSMSGNIIYMFTEASPSNRKWIIMVARLMSGFGGGNAGTIRGYIATASTLETRARAVAIGTAALSLGITAGPIIQACVTPIGYPGWVKGPLHISQYTAPAYVSLVAGTLLLIFLFTIFKENNVGVDQRKKKNPYHFVPKYDRFAVFLCILCWFAMFFCVTNAETVESPYTMAVFKWTSNDAVYYNSIIMACSSFISFSMYTTCAIYAHRINERITVITGLCMLFAFYSITFPWPFFTGRLEFKSGHNTLTTIPNRTFSWTTQSPSNHTDPPHMAGCDLSMEWCNYTPRLPLPVYLAAYPLISIGFPACNVAISTLFSKIIGPRRQGFVQSLMIMSGSAARLFGPILISWLFDKFGPRIAWTMTATMVSISIFSFTTLFSRLVPLKTKPKLKSGQKLRYDGGMLHHF